MRTDDVLILGAGFSSAVHPDMPLLDQLRKEVLERAGLMEDARVPRNAFDHGYTFEDWLSALSEPQPYLSEEQNLGNAALFAQLRTAIVEVLSTREYEACATELPRWFTSLVRLMHFRQATVITLNYDRLIEVALWKSGLQDFYNDGNPPVSIRSALLDVPPTRLRVTTYQDIAGWKPSPTLRLLKLHGSLDWWMGQGDVTGSTLVREDLRLDADGAPAQVTVAERTRDFTGREVFLVPPTLTKTSYFSNLVTRQLWQDAHRALVRADHVAIVGYSLPSGDSMMSGLLVSALTKPGVEGAVVNMNAPDVAMKVRRLGVSPITEITGEDSVPRFMTSYLDRADAEFREHFATIFPLTREELPVVVSMGSGTTHNLLRRVVRIETVDGGTIMLRTVARGNALWNAALDAGLEDHGPLPSTRDLAIALRGASGVVVDLDGTPDGLSRPVLVTRTSAIPGGPIVAALLAVVPDPEPK
jgi:hypothetical protein